MPKPVFNEQKIFEEAELNKLLVIFDELDKDVREQVLAALSNKLTSKDKITVLNAVRQRISLSDTATKDWLVQHMPQTYVNTMNNVDKQLADIRVGVPKQPVEVAQLKSIPELTLHATAVNALLSDAYLDFANGMNGMVNGVERQLNEALKRQIRAQNIVGQLTGQSIDVIKAEIVEIIGQQGFTTLVDRGGRQWSLRRYSEMLARTHIIKSGNEAVVNRAGQFDVDVVQVSTHAGVQDDLCLSFEGRLFSISGTSKKYPKLERIPPFHPNCRHSLLLRPDL